MNREEIINSRIPRESVKVTRNNPEAKKIVTEIVSDIFDSHGEDISALSKT